MEHQPACHYKQHVLPSPGSVPVRIDPGGVLGLRSPAVGLGSAAQSGAGPPVLPLTPTPQCSLAGPSTALLSCITHECPRHSQPRIL